MAAEINFIEDSINFSENTTSNAEPLPALECHHLSYQINKVAKFY